MGWSDPAHLSLIEGAPALVLAGADDILLPAAAAETLAGLLPRGRFKRHPGGHAFLSESTSVVARSVLQFLGSAREARG